MHAYSLDLINIKIPDYCNVLNIWIQGIHLHNLQNVFKNLILPKFNAIEIKFPFSDLIVCFEFGTPPPVADRIATKWILAGNLGN